ncbi:Lecithin-cholesterol acyltransferase-like 1 isoform A [Glycine soja]|uniref:Lecithin-cholesterol acyltransferase-like 1 isoform A n=1 Tax=Glycine soja TaxID=3848 RepID=A0A445KVL3_GLYSO|nr:Lecithin-cholesterol acyltransferase-like 1 isoform A [Glycine soja]
MKKEQGLKIEVATFRVTVVAVMLSLLCTCGASNFDPLILIPGNGGNQLEARLTNHVILAPFTQCFAERMTLHYHQELDDYFNTPGVQTRIPHFGSTNSLPYLNNEHFHRLKVTSLNRHITFRYGLAAEGHSSQVGSRFLKGLKNLIEEASNSYNGKPVILLSLTPWGGDIDEMYTFASGNTLGVPLVDPLLVRDEQRSSESNLWLLPNPKVFGPQKPIVITPNKTYSAHDMVDFLKDIGFPEGVYPYETRIVPLIGNIQAPQVPITCIMGTGVRTLETLFYGKGDFDERPEISYGDGDGTVNLVSLLVFQSLWKEEKNQYLKVVKIDGVRILQYLKMRLH